MLCLHPVAGVGNLDWGSTTAVVRFDGANGRRRSARYDIRALVVADADRLLEEYRRQRVEVSTLQP